MGSTYDDGAVVTLKATASSGYRFDHWSSDASGIVNTASITMNSNKNVIANFIKLYTLSTSVNPAAGGSIFPVGGTYDDGASVTLAATAASGYRFDHWSGDASGNLATVNVTMNADKNVIANFIKLYTLSTSANPSAGGSISPSGGTYADGTSVSLTATAASGYRFDHWSGDASGSTTTVNITMNGNKSVTATFIKVYTLTILVDPAAGGSVSPTGGIYDDGAIVTLTATAASGYHFDHWSGDASGIITTINITMNGNKSVTATFVTGIAPAVNISVNVKKSASGSTRPGVAAMTLPESCALKGKTGFKSATVRPFFVSSQVRY